MYRVSQKFVPLVTCDITFDRNYTSAWYFLKTFIALLSIYIRKVSIQHTLLCLLSRSEAVAVWSGIRHVPWRAGFSSRLVRAVFLDPSCFRSWVVIDNFIHYAPKILHRVDIWGIWGPSCFLYKIWQFFCTMLGGLGCVCLDERHVAIGTEQFSLVCCFIHIFTVKDRLHFFL